ncbi:MAG TPA: long-chain fatty acid--CoA ligase [Methylomirabilota bacterium]|jgi:long-chain acyl-CoA synthetase|nr:long-chain fatty acid--CoA ligase [Methylomirabilota bacterium]
MNVAHLLEASARDLPKQPALVFGDRTWTYAELDGEAGRVATGLVRLGLHPGERVCLHLGNRPEFVFAYYGCQKLGLTAVALNVTYRRDELAYIVRDSEAAAILTAEPAAAELPPPGQTPAVRVRVGVPAAGAVAWTDLAGDPPLRARDCDRDDVAAVLYTSATTGRPKGVMLTQANVVSNAYATVHHLRMGPDDRGLCALPLFHCFGQNFILNALVTAGGTLVLQERFVPRDFLAAIPRHRITLLYAVPTMYILFLAGDLAVHDLASLRLTFSAAAMLPADVEARWQAVTGRPICQGYGLTECSPFATYNHERSHRPGSVGTPIENVEVRVVDEHDQEVPDGSLGEIVIRGPNVMTGYLGKPAETAHALRGGWLHSGDIGYRDGDGYFYVVDRVKDMINVAGFKVYPREVEEVLFAHPAVREVAVLGTPDPVNGEAVRACIVLREGRAVTAAELIALCRERIAAYKVPAVVEFLQALPKSPTGKILKKELRGDSGV